MAKRQATTLNKFFTPFGYAVLSNGFLIRVRRLYLYELDAVPFDDPGPFVYEYVNKVTGRVMPRVYDLSQWPEPPTPPAIPEHECDPDSYEAALWHVYNTYQAALLQRLKQVEYEDKYLRQVAAYILSNCVSHFGRRWIKTVEDYNLIYELATAYSTEVKLEDIQAALAATFPSLVSEPSYL